MSITIAAASSIVAAMVIALPVRIVSVVITGVVRVGSGTGRVVDASYHPAESKKQTGQKNAFHRISKRSPNLLRKVYSIQEIIIIKFQEIQSRFVNSGLSFVLSFSFCR
jgi:hypothetical protein